MKVLLLACEVLGQELARLGPPVGTEMELVSMGLHSVPKKLHQALQSRIDANQHRELIVLGFGLCGGAAAELRSPRVPLIIPKTHDCIPLLLGSVAEQETLLAQNKGTFFLSGGWLEGERTFLTEHERCLRRFGEKRALKVLGTLLSSYSRFLFLRTGHPREALRLEDARRLAGLAKLPLEVVDGRTDWLGRLLNGPWDPSEFLRVSPGQPLSADAFPVARPAEEHLAI